MISMPIHTNITMKQAHCASKALEECCKVVSWRLEWFGVAWGDFWVRDTLIGHGAHRAFPLFKITTGVVHRGKMRRNHPIHQKLFLELIQLKGRQPTSTYASNLKEISWFYDYKSNAIFFYKTNTKRHQENHDARVCATVIFLPKCFPYPTPITHFPMKFSP